MTWWLSLFYMFYVLVMTAPHVKYLYWGRLNAATKSELLEQSECFCGLSHSKLTFWLALELHQVFEGQTSMWAFKDSGFFHLVAPPHSVCVLHGMAWGWGTSHGPDLEVTWSMPGTQSHGPIPVARGFQGTWTPGLAEILCHQLVIFSRCVLVSKCCYVG